MAFKYLYRLNNLWRGTLPATGHRIVQLPVRAGYKQGHIMQPALHAKHSSKPLQPPGDILPDHEGNEEGWKKLELIHGACYSSQVRQVLFRYSACSCRLVD